jgi:hypothetical protein
MIIPDTMAGGALILWFVLTGLSLIFLIYDLETNTPSMWVMKLAWILIVLYMGPIGLFIFMLSCRQPMPETHDEFIDAHWKQSVGSMMHCVAGDATGIILAAVVTFHLGLPNGLDLIIEYSTAFVVGLFIFQALFMKSMMGGNYFKAVKSTFFAETVSMNFVMVGMIPVMAIMRAKIPGGDDPKGLMFWGISSIATIAGTITAYSINSWLVGSGLKHGMMTAASSKPMEGMTGMSQMPGMSGHGHHKGSDVSFMKRFGVFLLSVACLLIAVFITSWIVELKV